MDAASRRWNSRSPCARSARTGSAGRRSCWTACPRPAPHESRDSQERAWALCSPDRGTGVSFKEVRIGSEFGDTPWSAALHRARCAGQGGRFQRGQLTNYKGTKLGFSGYFTTAPLIMTGPGSVTEANAGALNSTANGFNTYLVP
jgi:hypothetical protein